MKFSVASPGNLEKVSQLLGDLDQLNQESKNDNQIKEIFLSLNPNESCKIFGSGKDPETEIGFSDLEKIVISAGDKNIDVRLLLNSPNIDEILSDQEQKVELYLKTAYSKGIRKITVASELLLNYVKEHSFDLHVSLSSYMKIDSVSKAKKAESWGVDRIILSNDLNKDLEVLKQIRGAVDCELELMPNQGCVYQCPYHGQHGGFLDKRSREGIKIKAEDDPFKEKCFPIMINDPKNIAYLSPNRIDEVENMVDFVKIVGRQMSISWILKVTRAYMEKSYDGNVAEILVPTNTIADKVYLK